MEATIENLKTNRDSIISQLVELFGQNKLRTTMTMLKTWVEEGSDETIEELIEELKNCEILQESRRKTSSIAEMQGSWMEKKGYTNFNILTKEFE